MRLFGLDISFKKKDAITVTSVKPSSVPVSRIPSVKVAPLVYAQQFARINRGVFFLPPEYDLAEIGKIEDSESIVRQAFRKKEGLAFKEGIAYRGKNKATIQYLKTRMSQMSQASGIPELSLMKRTLKSLIRVSNAYLVKVRNTRASGGQVRYTADGKSLQPVAAYFPAAPEMFKMDLDPESGKIRHWRQQLPNGWYKLFKPEDVIHFHLEKREGFSYGVPLTVPVVDDIRALRQIEENIELLIYQHLFPLFHFKVGTDTLPATYAEDGQREVDALQMQIKMMPSESGLVTDHRVDIKALGAEGRALAAEGYMNYFKKRVYVGLGMSEVDFGETSSTNRAASQVASRALIDSVKSVQAEFEAQWDQHVIKELLLESTFGEMVLEEENLVHLQFNEIDIESKVKHEAHAADMFKKYGITWDEFRQELGLEPILVPEDGEDQDPSKFPEWHNTNWKLFEEPINLIRAVDEPYCYSKDTEILTECGWKLFPELDDTDKVAILRDGEKLEFEKPLNYFQFDYSGKMYHLDTRFINLLVTPNHRLYVGDEYREKGEFKYKYNFKLPQEVIGKYKKFRRSAQWIGEESISFTLPGVQKGINQYKTIEIPEKIVSMENWLKLLAWYISEGYLTKDRYGINICQSLDVHPENFENILETIKSISASNCCVVKGVNGFNSEKGRTETGLVFYDKQIYSYIKNNIPDYAENKSVPSFIKKLSPRLIQLFLNTMMLGDGEINYHYLYSTVSKKLANDVQELCLYAGWAASVRKDYSGRETPIYRVGIHREKYVDVADRSNHHEFAHTNTEEFIDYNDKVYCVETTTGIVYVRRNGHVCWCGNSPQAQAAVAARTTSMTSQQQQKSEAGNIAAIKAKNVGKVNSQSRPSKAPRAKDCTDSFLSKAFDDLERDTLSRLGFSLENRGRIDKDYLSAQGRSWSEKTARQLLTLANAQFVQGFIDQVGRTPGDAEGYLSLGRKSLQERIDLRLAKLAKDAIELSHYRIEKRLGDAIVISASGDIAEELHIAFDAIRYRAEFIWDVEIRKAYNFGRLLGMRYLGGYGFQLEAHDTSCEQCKSVHGWRVLSESSDLDDVPPFHAKSRMQFLPLFESPDTGSEDTEDDLNVGGSGTIATRQPGKPAIEQPNEALALQTRVCPRCGYTATRQRRSPSFFCSRCTYVFQEKERPKKMTGGKPISPMPPKKRKEEAELPASTGGPKDHLEEDENSVIIEELIKGVSSND